MIRSGVERLARGVAFKRRLPKEFGCATLIVTPDAALKYLKPGRHAFDRALLEVAREFIAPGDGVWDIGANVGVFSFASACRAGSEGYVLSVEPDIWLAGLIRRSSRLPQNRRLRIDVLPAAISDRARVETFLIAARGRASNALETSGARSQAGGTRERQRVPAVTLDQLLEASPRPDFVKIDVEGAEVMVLSGAGRLLSEVRPLLYCEVGQSQDSAVAKILHDAGYILVDPRQCAKRRRPLASCPFNTLACPAEASGRSNQGIPRFQE